MQHVPIHHALPVIQYLFYLDFKHMSRVKFSRGDAAEEVQERKCSTGGSRGGAAEEVEHVAIRHVLSVIKYVFIQASNI